jgi:hypothetical protein
MEILYRLSYSLSFIVLFSLFDYFGFNISLKRKWADYGLMNKYRVVQSFVQIILSILLFYISGWQSVAAFTIIWWTWGCDFLFYLFCEIFNFGNDRGNFRKEVKENNVQWAWWTPYGLLFTKRGDVINLNVLAVQAAAGLLISILICIFF